jgi:hypothetical protein
MSESDNSPRHSGLLLAGALLTAIAIALGMTWFVKADMRRNSRIVNMSCRASVGAAGQPVIAGFIIADQPQTVVVRALGPSLLPHGLSDALKQPRLRLVRNKDGAELARNQGWQTKENERLAGDLKRFAPGEAGDAACILRLPPGSYTAFVESPDDVPGTTMVEVFAVID